MMQRMKTWVLAQFRWVPMTVGLIAGMIVLGAGVLGIIKESGTLIDELGTAGFIGDAVMRLIISVGFAVWTAGPFVLAAVLQGRVRWPRVMAGFGLLVFAGNLYLFYKVFVVPTSSTAALGLIFFPFYLVALVVAFWLILTIAAKVAKRGKVSNSPPPLRGA